MKDMAAKPVCAPMERDVLWLARIGEGLIKLEATDVAKSGK